MSIEKTEQKEEVIIDKIVKTINKLDATLTSLDGIEESGKKHTLKKWYEEKKAMHEIKKILHEAGRYEKYDEKELDQWDEDLNTIV